MSKHEIHRSKNLWSWLPWKHGNKTEFQIHRSVQLDNTCGKLFILTNDPSQMNQVVSCNAEGPITGGRANSPDWFQTPQWCWSQPLAQNHHAAPHRQASLSASHQNHHCVQEWGCVLPRKKISGQTTPSDHLWHSFNTSDEWTWGFLRSGQKRVHSERRPQGVWAGGAEDRREICGSRGRALQTTQVGVHGFIVFILLNSFIHYVSFIWLNSFIMCFFS